jgi:hypothetical protein
MVKSKKGKNVNSADNQQERLKTIPRDHLNIGWIVGFTDGEGCFSVSIFKNKTSPLKWQVFPEFVITQGSISLHSLYFVKDFFGCGNIYANHRKGNRDNLYRYCVRSLKDLQEKIIPFFEINRLKTSKREDFIIFSDIVRMIDKKVHKSQEGLKLIARLSQTMNNKKPSLFLESSETRRQTSN